MHVLKIHNVKLNYEALARAMGHGQFFQLSFSHVLFPLILLHSDEKHKQMKTQSLGTLSCFVF